MVNFIYGKYGLALKGDWICKISIPSRRECAVTIKSSPFGQSPSVPLIEEGNFRTLVYNASLIC